MGVQGGAPEADVYVVLGVNFLPNVLTVRTSGYPKNIYSVIISVMSYVLFFHYAYYGRYGRCCCLKILGGDKDCPLPQYFLSGGGGGALSGFPSGTNALQYILYYTLVITAVASCTHTLLVLAQRHQ